MVSFESLGAVSYSSSIITNYRSILHQFRDKVRYWSKIVIFSYPFEFDVPVRGFPWEYFHLVWCGKSRMVELTDCK